MVTDMEGRFGAQMTGQGDFLLTASSVGRKELVRAFSVKPFRQLTDKVWQQFTSKSGDLHVSKSGVRFSYHRNA